MIDSEAGECNVEARNSSANPASSTPAPPQIPGPLDSAVDEQGDSIWLQWTRPDRWFFGVLGIAALTMLALRGWSLSGWGLKPMAFDRPESRKYEFQLDVNTANWVEWMQLEGVGEVLARRIVADREQNGPFQSVDDVSRVKGVGNTTLAKMRPWLKCTR